MTFTLVDTDILIDLAAEKDQAVSCVQQLEQRSSLCLSSITEMELIVGCRNKTELRNTDRLLERFTTISVNEQVSAIAVELVRKYRLSHGLLIADALIAATAIVSDYEFITKNQRDYRFIDGLKLLPYPPE
jgi:predicted nucleic acid-binding protein